MKKPYSPDCDCQECPADKKLGRSLLIIVIVLLIAYVSLEIYWK